MFGWIDTGDKNIPDFLDYEFAVFVFEQLEKVLPDVVQLFFLEGLGK